MSQVSANTAKGRRVWPKDIISYLIMPFTFPLWCLGRLVNPAGTDTYFIDREIAEQGEIKEPDNFMVRWDNK